MDAGTSYQCGRRTWHGNQERWLPITATDVWANDVADKLAKFGAEYHRVPAEEVKRWKTAYKSTKARAKWIGLVTHAANNLSDFPFRDSEAARWRAIAA